MDKVKLEIYEVRWTRHVVEIPTTCPWCGASLEDRASVREVGWNDYWHKGPIVPGAEDVSVVAPEADQERGDSYFAVAYECAACDLPVLDEETLFPSSPQPEAT